MISRKGLKKFCFLLSLLLISCQDPDAEQEIIRDPREARQVEGGEHAYPQKDVDTTFEDDFRHRGGQRQSFAFNY